MFAFLPEYNWLAYTLTFISFRIFDILKPYPIRYFDEKLESGLGIMVDDILAAIFALIFITFDLLDYLMLTILFIHLVGLCKPWS